MSWSGYSETQKWKGTFSECLPLPKLWGDIFAIFYKGKWKNFVHSLHWVYSGTSLNNWEFTVCPGIELGSNSALQLHSYMALNTKSSYTGIRFFLCKMGVLILPSSQDCSEQYMSYLQRVKTSSWCSKCSVNTSHCFIVMCK